MQAMQLTLREYYLKVALVTVRSAELEKIRFFNTLSPIGYERVMAIEEQPSLVRDIIGPSLPIYMADFDNVVYPMLKIAVSRWKSHCRQFGTDKFVTDRTVLEQWMEESMQNIAFTEMRSIDIIGRNPENFKHGICIPQTYFFPTIHAWQLLHER